VTDVQMQILRERFPGIGEPTLRANAASLLNMKDNMQRVALPPSQPSKCVKTQKKAPSEPPRAKGQRVPRTHNSGTWTSARYWSHVRSALRMAFRWWKPGLDALKRAKVGKGLYLCYGCTKMFPRKGVQIDHTIPAGTLTCSQDVAGFLERLTPESPDAFRVFCKKCHQAKTNQDRAK
jgi:hypothetical protein